MLSPSGVYLRKNARAKYGAILKSACRLFLKHGYTRTSMDDIAKDAGVSKQTVYSYFTNKDMLFCKMIEAECARSRPLAASLKNPSLKPEEALFLIGQGIIELMSSARGVAIHKLVMTEIDRHPRVAKMYFDACPMHMQHMLQHYLDQQVMTRSFVIDDTEIAAGYFYSMVKGRFHLKMQLKIKPLPTKKEIDTHIRRSVRMFYKMYAA